MREYFSFSEIKTTNIVEALSMIELCSFVVPINYPSVKGLIVFSTVKNGGLKLRIEFHQIRFGINEDNLQEAIMRNLIEKVNRDPSDRKYIFNTLDTERKTEAWFRFDEVENLERNLDNLIRKCTSENDEASLDKVVIPVQLCKNLRGKFNLVELRRIHLFVKSMLLNFSILSTLGNMISSGSLNLEVAERDVHPQESSTSTTIDQKQEENICQEILTESTEEIDGADTSDLDPQFQKILSYVENIPQLLSHLIHMLLTYYVRYDDTTYEGGIFSGTNPFGSTTAVNMAFWLPYLESLDSLGAEKRVFIVRGLVDFLQENGTNLTSTHLKCIQYILTVLSIKQVESSHAAWFQQNLENLILDPKMQSKLLTRIISVLIGKKTSGIVFQIHEIDKWNDFLDSEGERKKIDAISQRYAYLEPLSQERFAETVFQNLDSSEESVVQIPEFGSKRLLDVEKFLNSKVSERQNPLMVDTGSRKTGTMGKHYLSYAREKGEPNLISEAYHYFVRYLTNPVVVTTIPSGKIPLGVLKYFDRLKTIFNDNIFKKEYCSTMKYYDILQKELGPDVDYGTYLYIIFQIVVPYYYHMHHVHIFEDQFLNVGLI